jgi:hypothetical protein
MDSALSKTGPSRTWPLALSGSTLRLLEFLCLGGASLLVMAFCFCLGNVAFVMRDDVRYFLAQCGAAALLFTVVLSYPHTMWSYRFAYQQGGAFISRHSWELVGYPLLVIMLLLASALSWGLPITTLSAITSVERCFASIGVALNWSHYDSVGEFLLASLLVLQVIMAGYHYGMQALGVAIACGEKHGYRLQAGQKKYLRFNIYALWLVNLLSGYTFLTLFDHRGFDYHPILVPRQLQSFAAIIFAISIFLVFLKVILPIFKLNRKLPPLSSGVSVLSLWLWLQPFCQPFGFQVGVVPLAHGLQYLYFAGRAEAGGFDGKAANAAPDGKQALRLVIVFALLVAFGFVTYRYLPFLLDGTGMVKHLAPNFFILAAYIFLNTHHYMIDSVVWRGDSRLRPIMPSLPAS